MRVIAGGEADQPGHADVVGVFPLDVLLAAQRVHHRRLEPLAQRQELGRARLGIPSRTASCTRGRHSSSRRECVRARSARRDDRLRPAGALRRSRAGASAGGLAAPRRQESRRPKRPACRRPRGSRSRGPAASGRRPKRVRSSGCTPGTASADVSPGNSREPISAEGICAAMASTGHARSMAVEQAIDQMQIARPAAPGADGELSRSGAPRRRLRRQQLPRAGRGSIRSCLGAGSSRLGRSGCRRRCHRSA